MFRGYIIEGVLLMFCSETTLISHPFDWLQIPSLCYIWVVPSFIKEDQRIKPFNYSYCWCYQLASLGIELCSNEPIWRVLRILPSSMAFVEVASIVAFYSPRWLLCWCLRTVYTLSVTSLVLLIHQHRHTHTIPEFSPSGRVLFKQGSSWLIHSPS